MEKAFFHSFFGLMILFYKNASLNILYIADNKDMHVSPFSYN